MESSPMPYVEDDVYMEDPFYEGNVEEMIYEEFPEENNEDLNVEEGTYLEGSEELENLDPEDAIAQ